MKKLVLLFSIAVSSLQLAAQVKRHSALFDLANAYHKSGKTFHQPVLFQRSVLLQKAEDSLVKDAVKFQLNTSAALQAFQTKAEAISLVLPYANGKIFTLDLVEQKINSAGDFAFGEIGADGERKKISSDEGLHYRGCIAGDTASIAAFSIFANGDVMGLFANSDGNFVIGKMKDADTYILYNSSDLKLPGGIECRTDESMVIDPGQINYIAKPNTPLAAPATLCRKVRFYWELDYNLFRSNFNSNLVNEQNYITGLFNQVATMYQNEGITVELSEIYTWTVQDPYRTSSSTNGLNDFKARWNKLGNSFNGELAHLICGAITGNGGLAYIGVLCSRSNAYGYSNIWGTYKAYPTYSWDVEVITHEIGHNMGSRHTQWCGWNTGAGNTCGAIDNCATVETSGTACSTCSSTTDINALPSGFKGTVMSYCHLKNNIGIDLSLGFGSLPQAAIRSNVLSGSCLISNSYWTGAVDSLWSNSANWSCAAVPDVNTDVIIKTGVTNFPVIKSSAVCRRLNALTGGNVKINTGFSLVVAGQKTLPLITPPASASLFITGAATPGGLMNAGDAELAAQKFVQVTNTIYEMRSIYLTGGASYIFVPQYGNWSSKYGFTGTALTNIAGGDAFKLNGTDLKAPDTNGYYHIAVDFQRAKFIVLAAPAKVTVPASNELFITGTATPGGQMATGAVPLLSQKFTKISNTLYELASLALTANGTYVFVPVYGSFSTKYGCIGTASTNAVNGDYFRSGGANLVAPPVSGNYKITVDFQLGTFTLIKL